MQVKSCVVLVFTNVLMPVLINARVDRLAFVPLLFKGEHEDFDSRWYVRPECTTHAGGIITARVE